MSNTDISTTHIPKDNIIRDLVFFEKILSNLNDVESKHNSCLHYNIYLLLNHVSKCSNVNCDYELMLPFYSKFKKIEFYNTSCKHMKDRLNNKNANNISIVVKSHIHSKYCNNNNCKFPYCNKTKSRIWNFTSSILKRIFTHTLNININLLDVYFKYIINSNITNYGRLMILLDIYTLVLSNNTKKVSSNILNSTRDDVSSLIKSDIYHLYTSLIPSPDCSICIRILLLSIIYKSINKDMTGLILPPFFDEIAMISPDFLIQKLNINSTSIWIRTNISTIKHIGSSSSSALIPRSDSSSKSTSSSALIPMSDSSSTSSSISSSTSSSTSSSDSSSASSSTSSSASSSTSSSASSSISNNRHRSSSMFNNSSMYISISNNRPKSSPKSSNRPKSSPKSSNRPKSSPMSSNRHRSSSTSNNRPIPGSMSNNRPMSSSTSTSSMTPSPLGISSYSVNSSLDSDPSRSLNSASVILVPYNNTKKRLLDKYLSSSNDNNIQDSTSNIDSTSADSTSTNNTSTNILSVSESVKRRRRCVTKKTVNYDDSYDPHNLDSDNTSPDNSMKDINKSNGVQVAGFIFLDSSSPFNSMN